MAQDPLIEELRHYRSSVKSYVDLKARLRNRISTRTGLPLKPATIRAYTGNVEVYREIIQGRKADILKLLQKPKAERIQEAEEEHYRFNVRSPIALAIAMFEPFDSRYLFEMLRRSSAKDALIVLDRLTQAGAWAEETRKMLTAAGHFKKRLEVVQGGAA